MNAKLYRDLEWNHPHNVNLYNCGCQHYAFQVFAVLNEGWGEVDYC